MRFLFLCLIVFKIRSQSIQCHSHVFEARAFHFYYKLADFQIENCAFLEHYSYIKQVHIINMYIYLSAYQPIYLTIYLSYLSRTSCRTTTAEWCCRTTLGCPAPTTSTPTTSRGPAAATPTLPAKDPCPTPLTRFIYILIYLSAYPTTSRGPGQQRLHRLPRTASPHR